jgi:hypothetical protein
MTDKLPFNLYAVDPAGVNIVVYIGADAITSKAVTLRPAESIEVTQSVYEANVDRSGESWIDLTPEEQIERWGRVRFGTGDVPESVEATAKAEKDAAARQELDFMLKSNPHVAKSVGAARRAEELQSQIAGTR